jgi:hypothetical protein
MESTGSGIGLTPEDSREGDDDSLALTGEIDDGRREQLNRIELIRADRRLHVRIDRSDHR